MVQELKRRQWNLSEACVLYEDLIAGEKSGEEVGSVSAISEIKHLLQRQKKSLRDNHTAKTLVAVHQHD